MIDGFKGRVKLSPCNEERLRKNAVWAETYSTHNGNLDNLVNTRRKHKELFWKIIKTKHGSLLEINGSLNSYLNGDNKRNLTMTEVSDAVKYLVDEIGVQPAAVEVINLETGFGISTSIPPNDIVSNIILLKTHEPSLQKKHEQSKLLQFEFDEYEVKIYDRGAWLKTGTWILAVELKWKKSRNIKDLGIWTLEDLTTENLRKAGEYLVEKFANAVIYDPRLEMRNLTVREQKFMYKYRISQEWTKITSGSTRASTKKKFDKLIAQNIEVPLKEELTAAMRRETDLFLNNTV